MGHTSSHGWRGPLLCMHPENNKRGSCIIPQSSIIDPAALKKRHQISSQAIAFRGETLEELAQNMGCDPDALKETADRYNHFKEIGCDEDFGCDPEYIRGIGTGPYYAVHNDIIVITTIGGIDINGKNQVVTADKQPIAGLYSCGVESCTLYRETYNYQLSGGMNAYNFFSGRNAVKCALGLSW